MFKKYSVSTFIFVTILTFLSACGSGNNETEVQPPVEQSVAQLDSLEISVGLLDTELDPADYEYSANLSHTTSEIRIEASAASNGTMLLNGSQLESNAPSAPIDLSEGSNLIEIQVTSADGATSNTYSLTFVRQTQQQFAEQAFIKASNSNEYNYFGSAVALSGNTLVVGALGDNSGSAGVNGDELNSDAMQSGAVYVFVYENSVWQQQAYIKASNPEGSSRFGYSVAIDGDTLVVGAYHESTDASGVNGQQSSENVPWAGAAYVFTRTNGVWAQDAYLKASTAKAEEEFGSKVAISADTIFVGAPGSEYVLYQSDGGTLYSIGSVYVFNRTNGVWSLDDELKANNPDGATRFGRSISVDGDTLVIGASTESGTSTGINGDEDTSGKNYAGAVYIYEKIAGVWTKQAYIKSSINQEAGYFGDDVALEGDVLAVASPQHAKDGQFTGAGAVFIYSKSQGWTEQTIIQAPHDALEQHFGNSVAVQGGRILVGSTGEDGRNSGIDSEYQAADNIFAGASYLYELVNGEWTQSAYFKPDNSQRDAWFGIFSAMSEDFIVISAIFENSPGSGINPTKDALTTKIDSGAVYIFSETEN